MITATCKNTCTVPGYGLVEVGQQITVGSADLKAHPYLKHFIYAEPKHDEPKKHDEPRSPVEEPKKHDGPRRAARGAKKEDEPKKHDDLTA